MSVCQGDLFFCVCLKFSLAFIHLHLNYKVKCVFNLIPVTFLGSRHSVRSIAFTFDVCVGVYMSPFYVKKSSSLVGPVSFSFVFNFSVLCLLVGLFTANKP